nr:MAG TPA: hypothetical protein [Bacteriophage sp.]
MGLIHILHHIYQQCLKSNHCLEQFLSFIYHYLHSESFSLQYLYKFHMHI